MPTILHELDQWLVVDKPSGWHTLTQGDESDEDARGPTVEAWMRRARPDQDALHEAGIVHRLDRSTSGCLLIARSESARAALRSAISDLGTGIRKIYLAVIPSGISPEGSFALHFRGRHRRSMKVSVSDRGETRDRGRCRWRLLGSAAAGDLLEVELLGPGRRHQIRAGLAHLGFPLLGDALYRGGAPLQGLDGPALHAWRLEVHGQFIEAPLPCAWRQFQSLISRRTEGVSRTRPTSTG